MLALLFKSLGGSIQINSYFFYFLFDKKSWKKYIWFPEAAQLFQIEIMKSQ